MRFRNGILLSILFLLLAFALIFVPVYLIRPFTAQTKEGVRISYYFRTYSPVFTSVFLLGGIFILFRYWRTATHWVKKSALVLVVALSALVTWFSFQNYFQWMFQPLPDPRYVRAEKVDFLTGKDMVLTVSQADDNVAYPVRLLAYHHLVHDRVGGKPIVATY